ncbi:MAG: M23 family metallopeptidase [Bacteroidota bacterium]
MSKVQYKYNTRTLSYEKVENKPYRRISGILSYVITALVFGTGAWFIGTFFFGAPSDKKSARELEFMKLQYKALENKVQLVEKALKEMEERDNNVYRVILEAEPINENVRKAGFGGVDYYKKLEGYSNSKLMIETSKRVDAISKRMYIHSKSLDEIVKLANGKEQMLACIPAILPCHIKFLKNPPGGFGNRINPIYKTEEFHPGVDIGAPEGTPIYSTGDGVIEKAENSDEGYGNHVMVSHGFGYKTLYGHMLKLNCEVGQKVKRGECIGYVGSTGLSTNPHIHYEVIKNGEKINPINYYYLDLSPDQYDQLIERCNKSAQAYD